MSAAHAKVRSVSRVGRSAFASLLLSLGAAPGCGDDPQTFGVGLELSSATCGPDSRNLRLGCAGTLWVGVERFDRTPITHDCVDVSAGAMALGDIPQLLTENISLGALPRDTPLRLTLIVSAEPLVGCPESFPDLARFPVVSGSTDTLLLSEQGDQVSLVLNCLESPQQPVDGCEECQQNFDFCLAVNDASNCEVIQNRCYEFCGPQSEDQPLCLEQCETWPQHCVDTGMGPTIFCGDENNGCIEQCMNFPNPEVCLQECQGGPPNCSLVESEVVQCREQAAGCFEGCEGITPEACLL